MKCKGKGGRQMIFYFSGTGNSYAVARFLSERVGGPLVDIAQAIKKNEMEYFLKDEEKLGFVFPVYAWAPPKMVLEFVNKVILHCEAPPYTFGICTCGQSAGKAMRIFEEALYKKATTLNSGFSVVMPDNYILMFPVDSIAKQREILQQAQETMERIAWAIQGQKQGFFRVKEGKGGRFFTSIVHPMFQRFGTKTKPFYATEDCIGCGLCEKVCTDACIQTKDGYPVWTKETCNMCLACINRCPQGAIQYGKKTKEKGRYIHPCWK